MSSTFSELTKSQQSSIKTAVIELLKKNPSTGLTSSYISDQLQLGKNTTVNVLKHLRSKGYIDYSGSNTRQHKAGLWHPLPDTPSKTTNTQAIMDSQQEKVIDQDILNKAHLDEVVKAITPEPQAVEPTGGNQSDLLDELLLKADIRTIVDLLRETCTEPIDPSDVYLVTRLLTHTVGYNQVMLDTISSSLRVLLQHCAFHGFAKTGGMDYTEVKSKFNHDQEGL